MKLYAAALISISFLVFISCNFVLNNSDELTTKNDIVNTFKDEAKFLVKASKQNLDIIKLSKIIRKETNNKTIDQLTVKLEKSHLEILKAYNEIAEEKMISIPNYSNLKLNNNDDIKENIPSHLNLIVSKINEQIELLKHLNSNSENLKEITENIQSVLINNRKQTESILKNLII